MAKYTVTPALAEVIRSTRIQHHVQSKDIAAHIGKSRSYMSKLENGDIKTIQESELTEIFRYIFGDGENSKLFFETSLPQILQTLELKYSEDEITEQLWFYNYDTVLRQIPVPPALAEDLNQRVNQIGISVSELCARINGNEDINPEVKNTDQYPFNEWQAMVRNHKIAYSFIKMRLDSTDVEDILTKRKQSTNYITLLATTYYLAKFEATSDCTDTEVQMQNAIDYLNKFSFFSLSEKARLQRSIKSKEEQDSLLSSFDKTNINLINQVLNAFRVVSELNIVKMNKYLQTFVDNLQWDTGFTMRLISIKFSSLEDISFGRKKELLKDIDAVVDRYKQLPVSQKTTNIYD